MATEETNSTNSTSESTEKDNSARIAAIQRQISALRAKLAPLVELRDKILQAMEEVNACLSRANSSGGNILSQGNNTFTWLKNNMDTYWKDMTGSVRAECEECFDKLTSSSGPVAQVNAEASSVLAEAAAKVEELNAQIEEIEAEIAALEAELASL